MQDDNSVFKLHSSTWLQKLEATWSLKWELRHETGGISKSYRRSLMTSSFRMARTSQLSQLCQAINKWCLQVIQPWSRAQTISSLIKHISYYLREFTFYTSSPKMLFYQIIYEEHKTSLRYVATKGRWRKNINLHYIFLVYPLLPLGTYTPVPRSRRVILK